MEEKTIIFDDMTEELKDCQLHLGIARKATDVIDEIKQSMKVKGFISDKEFLNLLEQ